MTKVDRVLVMSWATIGYGYAISLWIDQVAEGVNPLAVVFPVIFIAIAPFYLAWWWYRTIKDPA